MSRSFNGSSDLATTACDLSGQSKVTVAMWLKFASLPGSNKILFEYSNTTNGFDVVVTTSAMLVRSYGSAEWGDTFTPPTDGLWHHYLFVISASTGAQFNHAFVDGVSQTMSASGRSAETYTWSNTNLILAARSGGSLFFSCTIAEFALWNAQADSPLIGAPGNQAIAMYAGFSPLHVWHRNPPTVYVPFLGDSTEHDHSGFQNTVTLTGTTYVEGPPAKTLWMR